MSSTGEFIFLIFAYEEIKFQGVVLECSGLHNWNNFSIPRVNDRKY
jgi:hypothetical protein